VKFLDWLFNVDFVRRTCTMCFIQFFCLSFLIYLVKPLRRYSKQFSWNFCYTFLTVYLKSWSSVLVLWSALCPMAYRMMLWSEQLFCLLISHFTTVITNWLPITVITMLLVPRRFRKVVKSLSSFDMSKCLLIRNSSRILPLLFVSVSCYETDLQLLLLLWEHRRSFGM